MSPADRRAWSALKVQRNQGKQQAARDVIPIRTKSKHILKNTGNGNLISNVQSGSGSASANQSSPRQLEVDNQLAGRRAAQSVIGKGGEGGGREGEAGRRPSDIGAETEGEHTHTKSGTY